MLLVYPVSIRVLDFDDKTRTSDEKFTFCCCNLVGGREQEDETRDGWLISAAKSVGVHSVAHKDCTKNTSISHNLKPQLLQANVRRLSF